MTDSKIISTVGVHGTVHAEEQRPDGFTWLLVAWDGHPDPDDWMWHRYHGEATEDGLMCLSTTDGGALLTPRETAERFDGFEILSDFDANPWLPGSGELEREVSR